MRTVIKGEHKRELHTLEERLLREQLRPIGGAEIYCWIVRKFERDARLARPQILQEMNLCKIEDGAGQLERWLTRWDACVERFTQAGERQLGDDELLYMYFKPSIMT